MWYICHKPDQDQILTKIKVVPLTQGYYTVVDNIDYDLAYSKWNYSDGYARRNIQKDVKRIHIKLHRLIMERIIERKLKTNELVDHKDENKLNNLRSNLRISTSYQNQYNVSNLRKDNTVGFKGVTKSGNKYLSRIKVNGLRMYLGTFITAELAFEEYKKASIKYHKEFSPYYQNDHS